MSLLLFPMLLLVPFVVSYGLLIAGTTGATRRGVVIVGAIALALLAGGVVAWAVIGLQGSSGLG